MIPEVSICIPTYNQPEFVIRAIDSIYEQTFQNFEIIITDDSDSDDVLNAVVGRYNDSRLSFHRNTKQLGSPENWNECLRHCRAPLIKFLHHDDWFAANDALERFVKVMQDSPGIDFAFSAAYACENDGTRIFLHQPTDSQIERLIIKPWRLQFANIIGAPSATIFRNKGIRFDCSMKWVVDVDFYMEMLSQNNVFTYIKEPLLCISANGQHQVTFSISRDLIKRCWEHVFLYSKRPPPFSDAYSGFWYIFSVLGQLDYNSLRQLDVKRKHDRRTFIEFFAFKMMVTKLKIKEVGDGLRKILRKLRRNPSILRESYAQCGEDRIINFLLMWLGINENITYLDIGANHPTELSNTYYFYKIGCRGVLVEPDIELCRDLRRVRPYDRVLNLAVGTHGDDFMQMYVMTSRTLNTLDQHQAELLALSSNEKIEAIREVRRLGINELIHEYFSLKPPTIVSLDIEGLDLAILKAWDLTKNRPLIFCVETLTYTVDNSEKKLSEIVDYMSQQGYLTYADTYINTIFVDQNVWESR